MTRRPTPTAANLPAGAPLEVLQLFVEWKRSGVSMNALARRSGYCVGTVRAVLRGQSRKPLVVRDMRDALDAEMALSRRQGAQGGR